jgi:hypothetical protein
MTVFASPEKQKTKKITQLSLYAVIPIFFGSTPKKWGQNWTRADNPMYLENNYQ